MEKDLQRRGAEAQRTQRKRFLAWFSSMSRADKRSASAVFDKHFTQENQQADSFLSKGDMTQ
jgi:hypothetical protein